MLVSDKRQERKCEHAQYCNEGDCEPQCVYFFSMAFFHTVVERIGKNILNHYTIFMKSKQRFSLVLDRYPVLDKVLRSPRVALFSIAVAAWALYQVAGVSQSAYDLGKEFSAVEAKKNALEKRNQELFQTLRKFASPEFLEREAKDRLNLKNPGEDVAVVVPEQQSTSSTPEEKSFWSRLQSFFLR